MILSTFVRLYLCASLSPFPHLSLSFPFVSALPHVCDNCFILFVCFLEKERGGEGQKEHLKRALC